MNVFGTSPVLADTDGDGYGDGAEIVAGFDPLGASTLSTEKKDQWAVNESKYGLNPPTPQTLGR
jgi:hypothetical protein